MNKLANMKTNADKLREALKKKQEEKENKESNISVDWKFKPEVIGQKTTYVLRILPNIHKDDGCGEPWLKSNIHIFHNDKGKKTFALCPKTFDEKAKCPLCEEASALFKKVNDKTASKSEEKRARDLYKKPRYYVNVLVVDDPRKGEASQKGKVLVWEFGNQIFNRLYDALVDMGLNFWSVGDGNNFSLVIRKKSDGVNEYPNYEASFFDQTKTNLSDYADLNAIEKGIHNLNDKILGKGAKSYDALVAIKEGKEEDKTERETDLSTGKTEQRSMKAPRLNEDIDLTNESSESVFNTPSEDEHESEQDSNDDILSALDDIDLK